MAGLSLTAADLGVRRARDTRPATLACEVCALGGLVTGVCAMTFAVVARLVCERLIARMPAGQ
jgi:hypothetical protein